MKKRMMSLLMALTMSLTLLPTISYAAEESGTTIGAGRLCEHTQDCYPVSDSSAASGVMASDAGNGEAAEPAACSHVCNEESGCIKQELDCKHEHDDECGYAPAVEGQSCTYACDLCDMTEITAWSWVDTQDVLDPESGVLALSASADSPALYEDIVALLPTEIEATTENSTETLSLDSWSCDDYPPEGAYTGSYAFHAVLPEGYGLAADAHALTVTVELDDEVMLMAEGQHSHCICGASHRNIGSHSVETPIPFDKKLSCTLGGSGWLEIDDKTVATETIGGQTYYVLPEGSYYLDGDVYLNKSILIKEGTVNICLNGHKICLNHGRILIWEVIRLNGGTLNLTDCKGSGQVCHHEQSPYGRGVAVYSTFNLYGGIICNNTAYAEGSADAYGGGVYIGANSTFNMYGGKISNNQAYVGGTGQGLGGGVFCNNGTFNLLAGEITENDVITSGNSDRVCGVGVYNAGSFNMSGGTISKNSISSTLSASQYGGGVCNDNGTFTMSGGEISGNSISTWGRGVAYGGGVYSNYKFEFTGGTITGNELESNSAKVFGGGVCNDQNGGFTMRGGTISNNRIKTKSVSRGGGVCINGGTLTLLGTANITENKVNDNKNNLYLGKDKTVIANGLANGAVIGVTTYNLPTDNSSVTITNDATKAEYFISDNSAYETTNDNGLVVLKLRTEKTYAITATAGVNGSISPNGSVSVKEGESQVFTITPNKGYEIASLKVDGKEVVNPSNTYTFTNVTSGHTIDVSFKEQAVVPPAVEAPTITKQPQPVSVKVGETATFTVEAAGEGLSYQWRVNKNDNAGFVDIVGANSESYTLNAVSKDCNGYQYQCVVSNAGDSVTSGTVTLTVTEDAAPTPNPNPTPTPEPNPEPNPEPTPTPTPTPNPAPEPTTPTPDPAPATSTPATSTTTAPASSAAAAPAQVTYDILDGAGSSWTQNTDGSLAIRGSGEISKFREVKVDGVTVDPINYMVTEGSTIITFKPEYLKSLSAGNHSFELVWTDGTAATNFTVAENADQSAKSPKTGEDFSMALCTALLMVSCAGLAGTFAKRKRNHAR